MDTLVLSFRFCHLSQIGEINIPHTFFFPSWGKVHHCSDNLSCHLKVTLNHVLISWNKATSHLFLQFPCSAMHWLPRHRNPNWALIKIEWGCRCCCWFRGALCSVLGKVKVIQVPIKTERFAIVQYVALWQVYAVTCWIISE